MTYPYGKRIRIIVVVEDASKATKVSKVQRDRHQTKVGSPKNASAEVIRWLCQKGYTDPWGAAICAGKIDFRLFGRIWKAIEDSKNAQNRWEADEKVELQQTSI